jgi:hypothetical protein
MKNTNIEKVVKDYFYLRLFILDAVSKIMYDSDKDYCKVDFNNSNLSLKFNDFELIIDDNYSVKINNENRFFDKNDFEKFGMLNTKIMSYSTSD